VRRGLKPPFSGDVPKKERMLRKRYTSGFTPSGSRVGTSRPWSGPDSRFGTDLASGKKNTGSIGNRDRGRRSGRRGSAHRAEELMGSTRSGHRQVRARPPTSLNVTEKAGAAALGCLLLILLAPPELEGQSLEGCGVDLRGGVAIPVGDVRDEMGPGWTLGAGLECLTRSPWALRGGVELAYLTQLGGDHFGQASALAGGGLAVPVERWPMVLRARLEGGWMAARWGGSFYGRTPRLRDVRSGPVLAPGVGVTLGSGDGRRARVDAGARILFQNPDPVEQVPGGSGSDQPGFDRVVSFVFTVGFRL
jgi:hypothetical protein